MTSTDDDAPIAQTRGRIASGISSLVNYGTRVAASVPALIEVSNADPKNIQEVGAAQLALSTSYYASVLAQARRSFIAAIVSAAIGLVFFVAAVSILLIRNDIRAGTISTISGAIVEVISGLNFWLYGRTAAQLNAFHIRLDQTQRYLLANSIATKLTESNRDAALAELIKQVASNRLVS